MKDGTILVTFDPGGPAILLDPDDGSVIGPWGEESLGWSAQPTVDPDGNVFLFQYVPAAMRMFDAARAPGASSSTRTTRTTCRTRTGSSRSRPSPRTATGTASTTRRDCSGWRSRCPLQGRRQQRQQSVDDAASTPVQASPTGGAARGPGHLRAVRGRGRRGVAARDRRRGRRTDDRPSRTSVERARPCPHAGIVLATLTPDPEGRFWVVLMSSDGSERLELVQPPGYDGFISGPFAGPSIYLFGWDDDAPELGGIYRASAADFGDLTQITSAEDHGFAYAIVAAPDGSRLLVFQPTSENGHDGHLLIMDADGSDMRRLNPKARSCRGCHRRVTRHRSRPTRSGGVRGVSRPGKGTREERCRVRRGRRDRRSGADDRWGEGTVAPRWSPGGTTSRSSGATLERRRCT